MTEREFRLPDLGEGLEEAEIASWLVAEGDEVALNDPLVEVETAKATVEIPSPFAGRVARIHAGPGATLAVGAPLVTFEVEEAPPREAEPALEAGRPGAEAVVPAAPAPDSGRPSAVPAATPAVRRLAKDLGVDLASLAGTGPGGRITREDVERSARAAGAAYLGAAAGEEAAPSGVDAAEVEVRPISMIRRTIAENLSRAVREIPHVTTFRTVDCTELQSFREELGVSPLPVVARALADVCLAHPMLNASYRADRGEIHAHRRCHVGIATDTERGLVVPVVRDADRLGIAALAAEIGRLAAAARAGTLGPADMRGGTITVTNTGSYGSEFGTPIINPPEGAILALGAIEPRALVVDGEVVARPACTLSLSFDHRLLDGAAAGRALGDLVGLLESRERLRTLPR